MKNGSKPILYSLREVPPRYKTLFGLEISHSEVVDVARLVMGEIGNVALGTYTFTGKICNYKLCLPCDLYKINWVVSTAPFNNGNLVPEVISNGDNGITITSEAIVPYTNVFDEFGTYVGRVDALNLTSVNNGYQYNKNVVGPPRGNYIPYQRASNNSIKINAKEASVEVSFDTIITDDEGLPLVEEKTVTALAYYLFYLHVNRGYFMKIYDANQQKLAATDSDTWMGRARVGNPFTDNEMNDIFQAAVTHNRKIYGLPFRTT